MEYVPYASLMFAVILIYLPRQIVGAEMKTQHGSYDNRDPRGQQTALVGRGKRALAAHQNAFETFAPFAAAVLACGQRGASVNVVAVLCLVFCAARVGYTLAYIRDQPAIRSPLWGVGVLATLALFVLAIKGP